MCPHHLEPCQHPVGAQRSRLEAVSPPWLDYECSTQALESEGPRFESRLHLLALRTRYLPGPGSPVFGSGRANRHSRGPCWGPVFQKHRLEVTLATRKAHAGAWVDAALELGAALLGSGQGAPSVPLGPGLSSLLLGEVPWPQVRGHLACFIQSPFCGDVTHVW